MNDSLRKLRAIARNCADDRTRAELIEWIETAPKTAYVNTLVREEPLGEAREKILSFVLEDAQHKIGKHVADAATVQFERCENMDAIKLMVSLTVLP